MYSFTLVVLAALLFFTPGGSLFQAAASRTLVAVLAHADDEDPVAPILARYAREGVQVHTAHVSFSLEDLQASARSMACHKSQFTDEVVQRVHAAAARVWNGAIPLIPAFPTAPITDLFR